MIFEAQQKMDVLETITHWIEEKKENSKLKIKIEDYILGDDLRYKLTIIEEFANCTKDDGGKY